MVIYFFVVVVLTRYLDRTESIFGILSDSDSSRLPTRT